MFTLITILILFGCYCTYKINQECKIQKIDFNPFEGKLIHYMGFMFGLATLIIIIVALFTTYLP